MSGRGRLSLNKEQSEGKTEFTQKQTIEGKKEKTQNSESLPSPCLLGLNPECLIRYHVLVLLIKAEVIHTHFLSTKTLFGYKLLNEQ